MEKAIKEAKITAEDIKKASEKYDLEKISEVIRQAASPEEAFETIHALYPEFEVDLIKKQYERVQEEIKETILERKNADPNELTQQELESVVGGNIFNDIGKFFKDNWRTILCISVIALSAVAIGGGLGLMGISVFDTLMLPSAIEAVPTAITMTGFGGGVIAGAGGLTLLEGISLLKKN